VRSTRCLAECVPAKSKPHASRLGAVGVAKCSAASTKGDFARSSELSSDRQQRQHRRHGQYGLCRNSGRAMKKARLGRFVNGKAC
jgi:hypothetical protein